MLLCPVCAAYTTTYFAAPWRRGASRTNWEGHKLFPFGLRPPARREKKVILYAPYATIHPPEPTLPTRSCFEELRRRSCMSWTNPPAPPEPVLRESNAPDARHLPQRSRRSRTQTNQTPSRDCRRWRLRQGGRVGVDLLGRDLRARDTRQKGSLGGKKSPSPRPSPSHPRGRERERERGMPCIMSWDRPHRDQSRLTVFPSSDGKDREAVAMRWTDRCMSQMLVTCFPSPSS